MAPVVPISAVSAQRGGDPRLREAAQLDLDGHTREARALLHHALDSTTAPAARAAIHRALAMSFAFDGDCGNMVKHEQVVIDYWQSRESDEPQNAFFQEGEMANEAARVCIDAGDLKTAEQWYRKGTELGLAEPAPKTHPASLWQFRLAHALGRLAARRGDAAEAKRQIAEARRILDSDPEMAKAQERFFPYLVGYVALYTNDLSTAEKELTKAVSLRGNENDPFMNCLLAMTYEKMGRREQADALYRKAYDDARANNPPAAFVRPFVRKKLGST
jgi:Flp pilus assembly protein TadD